MIVEFRTYRLKPGSVATGRGAVRPGLAGAHQIVAARRLLAHRGRPAQPHHPRLALRQFRGAHPHPRRGPKARRLAAQHPRVRRGAGERDLHPGGVLAQARAAPARRHLRNPHLHAGAGRDARRRSTAGAPRSPSAPSCRRWPSPAIPSSAGSTAGATSGPTRTPPSASRSASTPARKASGRPRAGSPARPWSRRTCWSSRPRSRRCGSLSRDQRIQRRRLGAASFAFASGVDKLSL